MNNFGADFSFAFQIEVSKMHLESGDVGTPKGALEEAKALNSRMKHSGNLSSKDMLFKADKIDLKSLDDELEKHLTRILSRHIDAKRPKEEWEIYLVKLNLQHVVVNGAYGTVYKGTYDGQDVAVKVLDWGEDGGASAASLRASFQQEVTVWQKLDHPNVTDGYQWLSEWGRVES
ncbi:Serine/threonine-protein kinase [Arachis hypogaea]|nr:Serine/threonine-protein kinase [Arachis hypogaea]